MLSMLEGICQLQLLVAAHPHPLGHQAVPLRNLPTKIHAIVSPPAAHTHTHRGQAVPMQGRRLPEGILTAIEPAIAFALSSN